jgi:hypothetical protein
MPLPQETFMTRTLAVAGLVAGLIAPAAAQHQAGSTEHKQAVELLAQASGMARTALETRVTKGKPYSADSITEFVQVLGDGNRIVRRTSARLYRDGEGRTRREDLTESGALSDKNSVVITDPVGGVSFVLDAGTKSAFKAPAMFARVQSGSTGAGAVYDVTLSPAAGTRVPTTTEAGQAEARRTAETATRFTVSAGGGAVSTFTFADGGAWVGAGGRGDTTKEDLGSQVVEGVSANGTRSTTVIPAGAIGNEQPITIVSEQWFSPDLEMLVLTRHSDPRVGETTYRLANIGRAEPDRSLFQVPSDYTVQERQSLRMRRQQ